MRVISGKYKGKKLLYEIEGTRPTMDRIKESLFAMLQNYIKDSIVLDLFAGSGSLGIEALSNGAKKCYFVDNNIKAIKIIEKNLENISDSIVINNDCFKALKDFNFKFDVVFLDPPYHNGMYEKVIKKIIELDLLNKEGIIVCESDTFINCDLELIKEKKYGDKNIQIFKKI